MGAFGYRNRSRNSSKPISFLFPAGRASCRHPASTEIEMKILVASSEVHPYSKSGGLADMVGALAKTLGRAGHDVGVVTPLYQGILERFPEITKTDMTMTLPLGPLFVQAEVWSTSPGTG